MARTDSAAGATGSVAGATIGGNITAEGDAVTGARWYCVKAKPGGLNTALHVLPTLPGVERVFYPKVIYMKRTPYGLRRRNPALFPGYLFACFPWEIWNRVAYTSGVANIVRRGHSELVEVPPPVMEEVFSIAPNGEIRLDDPSFHIGQRVRIISGAFNCHYADDTGDVEIVDLLPGRERVTVLLKVLGETRPVGLRLGQIDLPEEEADPRRRVLGTPAARRG
jgi:transcription antitermination factor NusG